MSESEFQHLTEDPPLVLLKKSLQLKTNQIALLKQQITQKDKTIQQNLNLKAHFQSLITQKQQILTSLTLETFKLSQKLIQQQQTIETQRQSLDFVQHEHKQLLQAQLQEKESLLIVIDQLDQELKRDQSVRSQIEEEIQKLVNQKLLIEQSFAEQKQVLRNEYENLLIKHQNLKMTMIKVESEKMSIIDQKQKIALEKQEIALEKEQMEKTMESKWKELEDGKMEKQLLKGQITTINKENEQLKQMNKMLLKEMDKLKQEKEQQTKQSNWQSDKIRHLSKQWEQSQSKCTQQCKQLQEFRSEITCLQSQLNSTKQQSCEHFQLYQTNTKQVERLTSLVNNRQQSIIYLSQRLKQEQDKGKDSDNQNNQLRIQLKDKQEQLIALHLVVKQLESKCPKDNHQTVTSNQSAQDKLKLRNSKLQQEIKDFEELLQIIQTEKQTYRSENQQLHHQLQSLKNYFNLSQNNQKQQRPQNQLLTLHQDQNTCHDHERLQLLQEQSKQLHQLLNFYETESQQKFLQFNSQKQQFDLQIQNLNALNEEHLQKAVQQSRKIEQLEKINFQLNCQLSDVQQIKQSLESKLQYQNEYVNEVFGQWPNRDLYSIQQIYPHLMRISGQIHENASLLEGTFEEKKKRQIESKNYIMENIKNILFNQVPPIAENSMLMEKVESNPSLHNPARNLYFNPPQQYPYQQSNQYSLPNGTNERSKKKNKDHQKIFNFMKFNKPFE